MLRLEWQFVSADVYIAQDIFAVCSFAFIRSTAMLDERLSNSGLVSNEWPLGAGERRESAVKKLLRET